MFQIGLQFFKFGYSDLFKTGGSIFTTSGRFLPKEKNIQYF